VAGSAIALLVNQACVGATGAQAGAAITPPARGSPVCILSLGAPTAGTLPTFDFHLESSDDDATNWTLVPGSQIAQLTTNVGGSVLMIPFRPGECKKYIRAVPAVGGTSSPSYPASAILLYWGA